MSDNPMLARYDDFATQHNAAYAAFSSIYETRFPPPAREPFKKRSLVYVLIVVLITTASVLVSGSRTIDEFGGGFIGLCAFIMVEGAILVLSFMATRGMGKADFDLRKKESANRRAKLGLTLAIVVGGAANIHSVLRTHGIEMSDVFVLIINVLVAISATSLAAISGDLLATEVRINADGEGDAEAAYRTARSNYDALKMTAWQMEKAKWGVKIEVLKQNELKRDETPPALTAVSSPVSHETPETRIETARRLMVEQPDLVLLSVTDLERRYPSISRATWHRAKRALGKGGVETE